jgi:hypothetical protein
MARRFSPGAAARVKRKLPSAETMTPLKHLYRIRSISVPDFYVAERAGGWGRMGTKEEALKETEEWWLANLAKDWKKHFVMEEADQ